MRHYQSFDTPGGRATGRRNLPRLRAAMRDLGLDALFVPHADEYRNEYQPAACRRLAWATGFTGSAGAALILDDHDRARVFVDGRYTVQAKAQLDPELFEILDLTRPGPFDWLAARDRHEGGKLGYDPRVLTQRELKLLRSAADRAGLDAEPTGGHALDEAWSDRPPMPASPVVPYSEALAGESSASKRHRLAEGLRSRGFDAALLTAPPSVAWLFNLRGSDVACTPIALARAILHASGDATLFLNPASPKAGLAEHLGEAVTVADLDMLEEVLAEMSGLRVALDPDLAPVRYFEMLAEAGVRPTEAADPCVLPRACKNATEIEGARLAHRLDGIAMCRFLHWLADATPSPNVTEIDAVRQLEEFRRDANALRDIAFETIAGSGPNGAIVHYRVDKASNRALSPGLFLCDSGGQYECGTTDVTRTVALGEATEEHRRLYTLVLKGHLALGAARFPEGTPGGALDALARSPLWRAGLDYDHGTGHGVGSYLGVHEGPQRIGKRDSGVALEPGMIVSNEPGYYREGAFGIRIENLLCVEPAGGVGGDRAMMAFETLTLAPYDRTLIEPSLLDAEERRLVDTYHCRVLSEIGPSLPPEAWRWLEAGCASI